MFDIDAAKAVKFEPPPLRGEGWGEGAEVKSSAEAKDTVEI